MAAIATIDALQPLDAVKIIWEDAHNLEDGWKTLADLHSEAISCEIETLGFFLFRTDLFAVLCADVDRSDEPLHFHTVLTIPLHCIQKVIKIDG